MQRLLIFTICLIVSVVAFAQVATTSIRGTVSDQTGAIMMDATVTITNLATQISQQHKVGKSGEYNFVQLQPATYRVTASAEGFGDEVEQVQLLVNQPATINFSLKVGAATQSVEVSASAGLNFTDATIGNAISNQQIATMPIDSRNVADLLSLQPGVLYFSPNSTASSSNPNATTDSRLGAVAGARSDQGNVTLDGIDDNDQTYGYAFTGVLRSTMDSTEEYRVTTASANSDVGRASGAQVTLVTKAGTDRLHGSLYEYFRNAAFDANDWFVKQAELNSGQPQKPGELNRNTFGGTIGGPILKDRLFFFFNYEGQRTAENQPVTQEVATDPYREGILQYKDASNAVHALSAAQVAMIDTPCIANGVCPNGPGPNAAILAYFAQEPHANGLTEGDGLNEGSYTFSSPAPYSHNTSILRLDWTPAASHHVFVRGNLQKDVSDGTEQFPGQPPSTTSEDNTKGITAGDTWVINSHLVNDFRYGYIRQGTGSSGIGSGAYTDVRYIASPTAETRSSIRIVPVNEITDTLDYTRGKHTIQLGGDWRLIHNNTLTDANSFNSGNTNPQGLNGNGLPQPTELGSQFPAVGSSFSSNYQNAYANLVGTTPILTYNLNYSVNPGGLTGDELAQGAFVTRAFIANEFEYYIQDSWRITPSLTITYGLRHTILQVPYDKNGQSAAPTIDTNAFFQQRVAAAAEGQVYEPDLTFAPNGPVYGKPGYWSKQKDNFAPRFAIAYALNNKTSIRAGAGMYYDHFGQGIVNSFNTKGSFGLASELTSPLGQLGAETAPRFISRTTLPNLPLAGGSPTVTFPYLVPKDSFSVSWGIDNKIKTPYSEVINLSIERELPSSFTLEVAYVGRFGRRLLQQIDLATPVNLVDTKSGMTYFEAASQMDALVDANADNKNATVPVIPYFENMFPQLAKNGVSATQNIYTKEYAVYRKVLGGTTPLADLDFYCNYTCPQGTRFWQDQFSSLYAWATIGSSSYNAAQFVLRHQMRYGLQMDMSYTYGNSIDMGSATERSAEGGPITNAFDPAQSRGVSDFDTRHLITGDGSYALPFGRGRMFGSHVNGFTDRIIGGWRLASIVRWTSGLPFSLTEGGYTTDWELSSDAIKVGNVKAKTTFVPGNAPNDFVNPSALTASINTGGPLVRLPYPGEAGERNNFRSDGYFGADASVAKPFHIAERQTVLFAAEVFNMTNSVRFNTPSGTLTSGSFGNYSSTLTTPRRMQFSLRYSF